MKFFSNLAGFVLGLAILAAMFAGAYFLIKYAATTLFAPLEHQVAIVTALVCFTLLIGALLIANSISRLTKERRLHKDKAELYHYMIQIWGEILSDPMTSPEEDFSQLEKALLLAADPTMIRTHQTLKKQLQTNGAKDKELREQVTKMVMDMRKDLGLSNNGIKEEDMADLLCGVEENKSNTKENTAN